MKRSVSEIRQQNLKIILETQFNDNISELADSANRAVGTVRKYLSPNLERPINNNTARLIERNLSLSEGYLDTEYHGDKSVYYVTLKVSRNFTFEIVQQLHNYPEAVECAAALGDFDVFIKVEVPSYHELQIFFDKISRLPGVLRTRTYPSVSTIRWQRSQSELISLHNPNLMANFAEEYRHQRILEHLEAIRKLEKGTIASPDNAFNAVDMIQLMSTVKREYLAIHQHDEVYFNATEYHEAEQRQIKKGIRSRRIITLPQAYINNSKHRKALEALLETGQRLIEIGSQIRFIYVENWIAAAANSGLECFAVIDGEFVYLKDQHGKQSSLLTNQDDIRRYHQAFTRNWERAAHPDQLPKN